MVFCIALSTYQCKNDECDAGYTEYEGSCIPDYEEGKAFEDNTLYYHNKHGIIIYKQNKWYNYETKNEIYSK